MGDNRSPCLKPLELPKKSARVPFTNTENCTVEIQVRIQLHHFFFLLISNKEVYSENYLMKTEAEQTIQREKQTEKKRTRKQAENNKELNTKERTKEQREGITSGESPSPRPIK